MNEEGELCRRRAIEEMAGRIGKGVKAKRRNREMKGKEDMEENVKRCKRSGKKMRLTLREEGVMKAK